MPIIARLIQLILTSGITANDVAGIVRASLLAAEAVSQGRYIDAVKAIEAEAPEMLPVVEAAASMLFPGAGLAIELLVFATAHSHKMTPAEEQVWFDRQNSTEGH